MKALAIAIALVGTSAYAQPAPTPPPTIPAPAAAGGGSGSAATPPTVEKAGTDESLQNGADANRPWAQGVNPSEQRTALAMFHDGNVQLNDGLFAKAADKYKEALSHWDHPAIHYNLALALMNLDQPIEAYDNFQMAVKYGEAPLQSKDKFDNAKNYMVVLDKEIGEVEVTCNKKGAKVAVDGREVFVAPGTYKGKVRVGKHTFVATLEGHPTQVDAPYISSGAPFRIELKLYTVAELTRYRRKWDATWMPYAVFGAGAVIAGVGALSELHSSDKYRDYDRDVAKCNDVNTGCANSSALKNIRSAGDEYKTAGFVLYGVGAAAAAVGITMWYLNRPESYQIRPEDMAPPVEPAVTVTPVVSPQFAGAALSGRF